MKTFKFCLILCVFCFSALCGLLLSISVSAQSFKATPEITEEVYRAQYGDAGDCVPILLTWRAPIFRDDGSALPLSELSGFELTHKKEGGALNSITITDNEAIAYLFKPSNPCPGKYDFSIYSIDTDNTLSVTATKSDQYTHGGEVVGKSPPSAPTGLSAGSAF